MSFGALHMGGDRRAAVLAVHKVKLPGVSLQMQSELNQADQHWIKLATLSGEHVLVTSALSGCLIRLLGQDSRVNELFETRGRYLFRDAGPARKILESPCSPKCLAKKHQGRTRSDSFQCTFNRAEPERARSVAVGETTRQHHRVSACIHVTRIPPDNT